MGIISGLVIGVIVGIALMAAFSRAMRSRSTKRIAKSFKKGQIIMDLDFRWGGDPSIILAVQALVASLPIQLKNLQVFTVVRVIFQLAEDIPCISAVVVALLSEVLDKDIGQDKRLGIARYSLLDLEPEKSKEVTLKLLPSLDTLKVRDKKDRGTITFKVSYHAYSKEEQMAAVEEEKKILEARKKLKEAGLINSTVDALDGAVSLVGSGVGLVGSGFGAVGSGIGKAGRFMGKSVSSQFGNSSKKNSNSPAHENGTGK